jgi:4-coumarate--CoA ligase
VTPVAGLPHFPNHFLGHDNYVEPSAYVLDGQDARKVCASIVLSSGTTGAPKAVMLSHHNLASICEQLRAHIPENWRGSQREIFFPPLSHIYGIYCAILMPCWLGSYICLMPSLDLDLYCRLLQDRNATLARLVPTVALMLAESAVVENYSYPNLEYFSCSAAPLKQSVAAKLRRRFPGVHLCQTYGCTELSSAIAQSGVRDKDVPLVAAGTIIANVQIRFIDEQGVDVPPHEQGEICINSPSAMMYVSPDSYLLYNLLLTITSWIRGYKDNDAATRESFLEPGWYKTGDIGYLDSKGYLIIVDRIKEVIKYKG